MTLQLSSLDHDIIMSLSAINYTVEIIDTGVF